MSSFENSQQALVYWAQIHDINIMYYKSTFFGLDFGDSCLCQRRNQRGINFPIERHLKRVFVDRVWLELLQVLVKGINAKRVDRDVVLGD